MPIQTPDPVALPCPALPRRAAEPSFPRHYKLIVYKPNQDQRSHSNSLSQILNRKKHAVHLGLDLDLGYLGPCSTSSFFSTFPHTVLPLKTQRTRTRRLVIAIPQRAVVRELSGHSAACAGRHLHEHHHHAATVLSPSCLSHQGKMCKSRHLRYNVGTHTACANQHEMKDGCIQPYGVRPHTALQL